MRYSSAGVYVCACACVCACESLCLCGREFVFACVSRSVRTEMINEELVC